MSWSNSDNVSMSWKDNLPTVLLLTVLALGTIVPPDLWPVPWLQSCTIKSSSIALVLWAVFSVFRYIEWDEPIALASLVVWWTLLWGWSALAAVVLAIVVFNAVCK